MAFQGISQDAVVGVPESAKLSNPRAHISVQVEGHHTGLEKQHPTTGGVSLVTKVLIPSGSLDTWSRVVKKAAQDGIASVVLVNGTHYLSFADLAAFRRNQDRLEKYLTDELKSQGAPDGRYAIEVNIKKTVANALNDIWTWGKEATVEAAKEAAAGGKKLLNTAAKAAGSGGGLALVVVFAILMWRS